MTEGHLSPERATQLIEQNRLEAHDLEHVTQCAFCNGWLRAFTALASTAGKKIEFQIPPSPDSN
jgi:hypothetical protein